MILNYFMAGSVSSASTTQTIICHFVKCTQSLRQVRQEFDEVIQGRRGEDLEKVLQQEVNIETVHNYEFLNRVVQEALRFQTPTQISAIYDV